MGSGVKILATMIALGLLAGCSSNGASPDLAGGEDFPNTRVALGPILADQLASAGQWNQFGQIPDTVPADIYKAQGWVLDSSSDGGAGKRAASNAKKSYTVVWDRTDTASGILSVTAKTDNPFADVTVEWVVPYDRSIDYDSIFGDSTLTDSLRIAAVGPISVRGDARFKIIFDRNRLLYHFTDTDTNGWLDSVEATWIVPWPGGLGSTLISARGASGNDNHFTDNTKTRVPVVRLTSLQALDTLAFHELRDTDGDGLLYDTLRDSNEIRYRFSEKGRFLKHPSYDIDGAVHALIAPSDPTALQVTRFDLLLTAKNDLVQAISFGRRGISIYGTRSDSCIIMGDTAFVRIHTVNPQVIGGDTVTHTFTVALGDSLRDASGHAVVSYSMVRKSPRGIIESIEGLFTPVEPITVTSTDMAGTISATILLTTGTTIALEATVTAERIEGTFTAADGTTAAVKWDRQGNVVQ